MKINERAKNQIFHQRKIKKFITLKHKPNPTVKTKKLEGNKIIEKSPTSERTTDTEILIATKNPSTRTTKTNFNNYK